MPDNDKLNFDLLPFDELLNLHKNGLLSQYAEEVTQSYIEQCTSISKERKYRLHHLSLKLSAIRARHPRGLRSFLEISKLMQTNHAEFEERVWTIIHGNNHQSSPCSTDQSCEARVLPFRPAGTCSNAD